MISKIIEKIQEQRDMVDSDMALDQNEANIFVNACDSILILINDTIKENEGIYKYILYTVSEKENIESDSFMSKYDDLENDMFGDRVPISVGSNQILVLDKN